MPLFFRQVVVLLRKDLREEFRSGHHFVSVLLFAILILLLFSFALGVEPDLAREMAGGLFWLTVLFASTLILHQSIRRETEEGQWEGLLLLGIDPKALFLGKALANLTTLSALQLILLPLLAVLFDIPLSGRLIGILILGSLGISVLGTFYAGITATFREGPLLLPLLLFPMMVPVLLSAVHATELTLVSDVFGQQQAWLKLLVVFDTVFFLGCLLCADLLFDVGAT